MINHLEIDFKVAKRLIENHKLVYCSSFSNNEPSDLCSEYRMETGYSHPDGNGEIIRLVTTKDNEGNDIHRAFIFINEESILNVLIGNLDEEDTKELATNLILANADKFDESEREYLLNVLTK